MEISHLRLSDMIKNKYICTNTQRVAHIAVSESVFVFSLRKEKTHIFSYPKTVCSIFVSGENYLL